MKIIYLNSFAGRGLVMMRLIISFFVIGLTMIATPGWAILGSGVPDLEKFRGKNTERQTLVYIDQSMMKEGDTSWADRIDAKLASTLMPAESVTVMRMDADSGVVEEVWSGYWPDYTASEKEKFRKEQSGVAGFFSKDPLKELPEEQQFFRNLLGGALGNIYKYGLGTGRSRSKKVMLALASDEDRFNKPGMVTRVIIYSDMKSTPQKHKLSLDFGYSVFYVFGVDAEQTQHKAEWDKRFLDAHGLVAAFGSDLGMASGAPVSVKRYDLEFTTTKNDYLGDMVLLVTEDGKLQDSYAAIRSTSRPIASLIKGSCKFTGDTTKVNAETRIGLATYEDHEQIELSGHGVLNGFIGHPEYKLENGNPAAFTLKATPVN